ncbi:unnamed protein product [Diatraea saccharalis]|uniref:Uncharacterized protein n=1 Tax=Diatraea saccharalis TaxID=40085 RepID=A0A9N9RCH8_9NEOP|nr:unnamed protein product [Diatraea saccharalis]
MDIFKVMKAENILRLIHTVLMFISLISPSLFAGLLPSETRELEINIYDRLLFEKDIDQEYQLMRFAEYVAARPNRLRVMMVVPLDWSLPLIIFNVCVSYQIVILQFNHLL